MPRRGFRRGSSRGTTFDTLRDAVSRVAGWLIDRQADDGHWRAALEGDTILESEYLLLLAWQGRLDRPEVPGAARRLLEQQLPEGGWAIYPGGPAEISASVKAYLALKLLGHRPEEPAMRRAAEVIQQLGGPWAVNSFTRFYLALLGQMPYSACPAVPPEMALLPRWFPINLHSVSAWSRTMIVPLSLMWTFKPLRRVPAAKGIGELFGPRPPAPAGDGWERFFRGIDRLLKACESLGLTPLRRRAVAACRRWMLERFDGSDGLGAIFPPIVWSIIALESMGCRNDSPEVQEAWKQLERLIEREPDGTTRLEPCRSPVWDTAITLRSLCDATSVVSLPGGEPLDRAADWLLAREIRSPGDWAEQVSAEPSGWCFEYANRFYPDVDDTAMVLLALADYRLAAERGACGRGPESGARLRRLGEASQRGLDWLLAMQNADGGWGAFDKDNTFELLCKVPFADHNAMIDPSSPDLAGRVLEALGRLGLRRGHVGVDRGVAYLRRTQDPDGGWFGRWGVNYLYGTWQAIQGLVAVGVSVEDDAIRRAVDWLCRHQQPDGGWGESPRSYEDSAWVGRGEPTASQTAWAVAALAVAGHGNPEPLARGVDWLLRRQKPDGSWEETAFTGTGFPKVFYLRYHYYPIYFPLLAMSHVLRNRDAAAQGVGGEAALPRHDFQEV